MLDRHLLSNYCVLGPGPGTEVPQLVPPQGEFGGENRKMITLCDKSLAWACTGVRRVPRRGL